ncbi:MAG TPA: hypothetical protein VK530_08365, partial [Candidatus Acidoferrum sp.]|nr:hypothetical protein [Candidatus Acidoferrum sp.]
SLRVRCWWETTNQGVPKTQITELVQLTLDGKRLDANEVTTKGPQGNRNDHYYIAVLRELEPGMHSGVARLRVKASGREIGMPFKIEA